MRCIGVCMSKKIFHVLSFSLLLISFNQSLLFAAPLQLEDTITGSLFIDGEQASTGDYSQALEWRFRFSDILTEMPIVNFKQGHGKMMHLLVVKDDFSTFAHVHPTLVGNTGEFSVVMNQETSDPDNVALRSVIPNDGRYFVFAEVFPNRGQLTPKPEVARWQIVSQSAAGAVEQKPIVSDVPNAKGERIKYYKVEGRSNSPRRPSRPVLVQGTVGDEYRAKLRIETVRGCGGNMVNFIYSIDRWSDTEERYKPVQDLQGWMGMGAHAILLNTDGQNVVDKQVVHVHAMGVTGRGSHTFRYFDRQVMNGRQYKIWAQFKHEDWILTFPFVFDYQATYVTSCLPAANMQ